MSGASASNTDKSKRYQGHDAQGRRVKVFWEDENCWKEGTIIRYSESKDEYLVQYDKGKEWESLDYLEFIDTSSKDMGRGSVNGDDKAVRRSSRVAKRENDEEEEEEEEEEPKRVTRTRRQSNGSVKSEPKEVIESSGESDGEKPAPKRKAEDTEDEVEEEEEEEEEEDFELSEGEEEVKSKRPSSAKKKKEESDSEYEEQRKRPRRKSVQDDEEEEEDEIDDEEDDDDEDGVTFKEIDDDEEDEEETEESDSSSSAPKKRDVDMSEGEEEDEDEEDFKEEKKKRGRKSTKKTKKVVRSKPAAPRPRARVNARPVPTDGIQQIFAAKKSDGVSTTTTVTTTTTQTTTMKLDASANAVTTSAVVEEEVDTTTNSSNILMLVKFRNKSHREVEWLTADEIIDRYPSAKIRVRKILGTVPLPDEQPNPEYSIIDRIVDKLPPKGRAKKTKYLVKWRGLPYEECTWEEEDNLKSEEDLEKIKAYNECEAAALKRSNKPRKIVKFNKTMDPPTFLGGRELKDFQKEGFLWLAFCWHQKRSSLLADEMGLGKTIQTISLLEYLRDSQGIPGPFLVIAPLSTIENWQREITDWTGMRTLVLHGKMASRDIIRNHEWTWPNGTYKFDALVTSYEIAIAESALISSTQWKVLVVDEAHRIKSQTSKLLSKLVHIRRDHCVMLTGTPLQNDMK